MSAMRVLVASLLSYLAITHIGGNAQAWPSDAPPSIASSNFLFSVDVVLDESTGAVPLGIRHGQTVSQAAVGFCREQGLDEAMQTALMPQLVKVLDDGIAEVVGPTIPVSDEASIPSPAVEHTSRDAPTELPGDATLVDPALTLGISMDGENERTLSYYAGQNPMEVAVAFCTKNLVSQSPTEALARCSDTISAHIIETLGATDVPSTRETQAEQQQEQQKHEQKLEQEEEQGQSETHETLEDNSADADAVGEQLMMVPLNINGLETVLQIFRDSNAEVLANELCRRAEFDLDGSSLDSCFSQIVEIVHRANTVYERKDGRDRPEIPQVEPFTFKVPVTLAGLQLHVEFKTSETPRAAARRFCTPNLLVIESALGLELYDGEDEDRDEESMEAGFFMSEGRESLREACTVVVEDAINAVLLGMRERVLEAELAQANETDSSYNDRYKLAQKGNVAGEAWVASQIVAHTLT